MEKNNSLTGNTSVASLNVPLLPQVVDDKTNDVRICHLDDGKWTAIAGDGFQMIRDNLSMDRYLTGGMVVTSIPDLWARPLVFTMALLDRSHVLHQRVTGEWRGMLALLALQEVRGIEGLEVAPVDLSADLPNGGDNDADAFKKALIALKPEKSYFRETNWDKFYLIRFQGKAIGMTSPCTLVCTAADYYGRIENVGWFDGRYLLDPTGFLNREERQLLADWVKQLATGIAGSSLPHEQGQTGTAGHKQDIFNDVLSNDVLKQLDQFINDLDPERGWEGRVEYSSNRLGMNFGVFQYLDRPIKGRIESIDDRSMIRLLPQGRHPGKEILVIGESMWEKDDNEVFVGGPVTLAAIPFQGLGTNHTMLGKIKLPDQVEWRKPEDFFTGDLFILREAVIQGTPDNPLPGADYARQGSMINLNGDRYWPILPIKPELLDYLSASYLKESVKFSVVGDNTIRVELILPLSGGSYSISHDYSRTDNRVKLIQTPILAVWPFLRTGKGGESDHWSRYYTYYDPIWNDETSTFRAEPYLPPGVTCDPPVNNIPGSKREYYQLPVFPEAMICRCSVQREGQIELTRVVAGIILLQQPETVTILDDKRWTVGIDFGTTSTNIFAAENDGQPSPVIFREHSLQVTAAGISYKKILWDDFIPYEYDKNKQSRKNEFLTIFKDFKCSNPQNLVPITEGHIQYLVYQKITGDDRTNEGLRKDYGRIINNLKWGSDKNDFAKAFLKQLCIQTLVEAAFAGVGAIQWRFSYPTSFTPDDREIYQSNWKSIIGEYDQQLTGIATGGEVLVSKPESVAIAHYFLGHQAAFNRGVICVDIGGETSDISIWQGSDNLLLQNSIRFAGRCCLLELLRKRPDFLEIFDINTDELVKSAQEDDRTNFYLKADTIFQSSYGTVKRKNDVINEADHKDIDAVIFESLPNKKTNPQVKNFISLIALGVSGIFYYLGLQLRYLHEQGLYQMASPDIYLGGNGSKLLHWIANGHFKESSNVCKLLKAVIKEAFGQEIEERYINIIISSSPKSEAAYGLIWGSGNQERWTAMIEDKAAVVAGEEFEGGAARAGKEALITGKDIKSGIRIKNGLNNLNNFLAIFNKFADQVGLLPFECDDKTMHDIVGMVNTELENLQNMEEKKIQVEPLFIMALRMLVDRKAEEWRAM